MNDNRILIIDSETYWEETEYLQFFEHGYSRVYKEKKKNSMEYKLVTGDFISYDRLPIGILAKVAVRNALSVTPFVPEGFIPYEERKNKVPLFTEIGDKCPVCNNILVRATNRILLTAPAQQEVKCSNKECDYEGNQFIY